MAQVPEGRKRSRVGGRRRAAGLAMLAVTAAVLVLLYVRLPRRPGPPAGVAPAAAVAAGVRVGERAPEFRVVDIEGREVTLSALVTGRPGLIFFTATWCFPCVVGLQHLQRFEREAGGRPFNVLVVFVDPTETDDDVRAYRRRFNFPAHWHYARDTDQMVLKYRVRYLDTKLVLDPAGVVRYADVAPATYETWRRALATVGVAP